MSWNERRELRKGPKDDARDDWDIDYARIIHSASFRRLQGKTQILNLGDSEFYRTRLGGIPKIKDAFIGFQKQLYQEGNP